jgi:hypothetical protein
MPKKMTIETNEVAEDRTYHIKPEEKMSIISHWTGLRTAAASPTAAING